MIGWLLDTNVISELASRKGSPQVKAWAVAQPEETFFLSILTIAEYDKGIANLPENDARIPRYAAARDGLLSRFAGRVLPVSDAVVRRWGVLSGTIRRNSGHPPPVIDTLLAATAVEHDLYLVTRNVRDVRGTGALVFNPWLDDPELFPLVPSTSPRLPRG